MTARFVTAWKGNDRQGKGKGNNEYCGVRLELEVLAQTCCFLMYTHIQK